MRRNEGTPTWAALFALFLCTVKGLLAVTLFAVLPPAGHAPRTHAGYFAAANHSILDRLERASLRQEVAPAPQTAKLASPPLPLPRLKAPMQVAFTGFSMDEESHAQNDRLLAAAVAEGDDKPLLARSSLAPRAPPRLGHEPPSPYAYWPPKTAGVFLAWARPPPRA